MPFALPRAIVVDMKIFPLQSPKGILRVYVTQVDNNEKDVKA
jgi:hypothetical protein